MARGKAHDPDKRAQVTAAILAGTTIADAARQFKVAESTARSWAESAGADFGEIRAEKKAALEELIADYLTEGLITLREQLKVARQPEYLERQNAESFAVLHGVIADKLLRVIEAHAAAQPLEKSEQ